MARFIFILFFLWTLLSCTSGSRTTVSVHIDGAQADSRVDIVIRDSTCSGSLDSTGTVSFELPGDLPAGYGSLQYGRISLPVYLEAGKDLDVSLVFRERILTPVFNGEAAAKNDYLNGPYFREIEVDYARDEEGFIAGLAEQERKLLEELETRNFDEAFTTLERQRIHFLVYGVMGRYVTIHPYHVKGTDYRVSDAYCEVMKSAITEVDGLQGLPEYENAWKDMVEVLATRDMVFFNQEDFIGNQLDIVTLMLRDSLMTERFVHRLLKEYVSRSGIGRLERFLPVYEGKVKSPELRNEFAEVCGRWRRIAEGRPSPSFRCPDIKGREVSLAELAGKYVYIGMWATWCGPCRSELPYMKRLVEKFRDRNIAFVSISCDTDRNAWERMVREERLGGIQLFLGHEHNFTEIYMVRSIPRFILLDREGRIIRADMSRPSNVETEHFLEVLEGI